MQTRLLWGPGMPVLWAELRWEGALRGHPSACLDARLSPGWPSLARLGGNGWTNVSLPGVSPEQPNRGQRGRTAGEVSAHQRQEGRGRCSAPLVQVGCLQCKELLAGRRAETEPATTDSTPLRRLHLSCLKRRKSLSLN